MNSAIYPMATNSEWRADISQSQQPTVSTPNGVGPAFLGPSESMFIVLYIFFGFNMSCRLLWGTNYSV